MHSQTTLAMPHSPHSSSKLCRAARTTTPQLSSSLKNPKAPDGRAGLLQWLQHSPTQGPHSPINHLSYPQQPAGRASSWQQAERMMLFHKAFIKPLITHPTNARGLCSTYRKGFAGPAVNLLLSSPPREQEGKGMCCWGVTVGWSLG